MIQHVVVVGAGVIGLTTAVGLAETGHRVDVVAAEPPRATTSAVAGALWGPWLVEPRERVLPWAAHTLKILRELAEHPNSGVRIATGIEVSRTSYAPPDWAGLLPDRTPCASGPFRLATATASGTARRWLTCPFTWTTYWPDCELQVGR